jgi:hypothetical protein
MVDMPNWEKGQRAVGHMVEQGLRVQALRRQLIGVRTDDARWVALNDQIAAENWRWNRITVQAIRHGMDAEYLGDKLDDAGARGPVAMA